MLSRMLVDSILLLIGTKKDDFTDTGLDESKHQAEQRGLADTRRSHDSRLATWQEVVREMMEYLTVTCGIGKTNIMR